MNFLPAAVGATFLGAYVGVLYVNHKLEVATRDYPLVHPEEWDQFRKSDITDVDKALIVMSRIVDRSTSEHSQLGKHVRKIQVPKRLSEKLPGLYDSHSVEIDAQDVLRGFVWSLESQRAFRRFKKEFDTKTYDDPVAREKIYEIDKMFDGMHWLERKLWKYMVNDNRRVYAKGN